MNTNNNSRFETPEALENEGTVQPAADEAIGQPPTDSTLSEPTSSAKTGAVNPFDPATYRLSPNSEIGVRRKILTIKCDKPSKTDFVRVHPSEDNRLDTALILDTDQNESYFVSRDLWDALPDLLVPVRLCVAVNRHGTPFLWMAKLPDPDGRSMGGLWHTSMLEAQALAVDKWVKVSADRQAGSYSVWEATGKLPEPQWPELSLVEMLELAFKGCRIDSLDHPYLRALRGEV